VAERLLSIYYNSRIFVKQGANLFQIVPRIKEHVRKQNSSQALEVLELAVH